MNNPPVIFFQVAATAIPTLLIAVAVGLKHAEIIAKYFQRASKRMRPFVLAFWIGLVLIVLLGEFAALRAVARGAGNGLETEQVWGAILMCLLLIVIEMIQPLGRHMSLRANIILLQSVAGFFILVAIYTYLILNGVVPL